MRAPLYEYTDDPHRYQAERAAYLSRQAYGERLVALLCLATGAGTRRHFEPSRATFELHREMVALCVALVRRFPRAARHPHSLIGATLARRGVTEAELESAP